MHIIKEMVKPYVVLLYLMEVYGYESVTALFPTLPAEEAIRIGLREACADVPLDLRNTASLLVAAEINRAQVFDEDELSVAVDVIEDCVKGIPIDVYGDAPSPLNTVRKGIIFCMIEERLIARREDHHVTLRFKENAQRFANLAKSVRDDNPAPEARPLLYKTEEESGFFYSKRLHASRPLAPFSASSELGYEEDAEGGAPSIYSAEIDESLSGASGAYAAELGEGLDIAPLAYAAESDERSSAAPDVASADSNESLTGASDAYPAELGEGLRIAPLAYAVEAGEDSPSPGVDSADLNVDVSAIGRGYPIEEQWSRASDPTSPTSPLRVSPASATAAQAASRVGFMPSPRTQEELDNNTTLHRGCCAVQ
jgi:hypothetical protein